VKVESILVVGIRIDIIVSETGDRREFMSRLRVEVRVADTPVQGVVPDPEVRQTRWIILSDGEVPHHVCHEIARTLVPT
jgi:hypothetical protein